MKASAVQPSLPFAQASKQNRSQTIALRHIALLGSLIAIFIVHFAIVRPWHTNWGATKDEQTRSLPGDQFVTSGSQSTHAITINAPSSLVWKWVAQLGQDRGGFYSYDILENMVGCKMPTSDYLRREKQNWKSGDRLWMYPPAYNIDISGAPLQTYIPGYALGFGTTQNTTADSSWTFVVQPIDASHTRLIIRSKAPKETSIAHSAFNALFFDQAHFVMEKRMMLGIKQLAEGTDRGRMANHMQVTLWTIVFALWVLSIVLTLRRREWRTALAGFIAGSAVFQILTFGQPTIWIGALMALFVAWLLSNTASFPPSATDSPASHQPS